MTMTYRDAQGSKLTIAEVDENFRDLDARVSAGGGGVPVPLTASTALTVADHANREINTTAASAITLTLPATAATGTKFFGTNLGAGALSVVLDGGGVVPRNALLPPTIDQFSAWEVRRHASGWVRVA